ncbi:MFS transporter [Janthinobacterium sp.]|uniref:MFS transporter n=1 Tax=Janthinobacterium sp. TaxID=1871054 RepID=UPI00289C044A|nr:MFS transporter [Janthinobacterium sp.]
MKSADQTVPGAAPRGAVPFIILGLFGLYTLEFGVVGMLPQISTQFQIAAPTAALLMGVFALAVALCGPLLVLYSSRLAHKRVLVTALFMFALSTLLSAVVTDFRLLLALRVLAALFHPMFYSAAISTTIALYPPERSAYAVSRAVIGSTVGMVVGVPVMGAIATTFSYQTAFLFCTAVSLLAGVCILVKLPASAPPRALSVGQQLSILKAPTLWLNGAAAVLMTTALFSVFSYAAIYLQRQLGLDGTHSSLMLSLFGIGGVGANLVIGRFLDRHLVATVLALPWIVLLLYLVLSCWTGSSLLATGLLLLLWGVVHCCGMVSGQAWLRSVTATAQDFATSLFLTAANAGVMAGSSLGGLAFARAGMRGAFLCGAVFAILALVTVVLKVLLYGRYASRQAFRASSLRY